MSEAPVQIDGSLFEGGGQLLRFSLVFASITQRPLIITNIRAGRDRPGLRPAHTETANLIARMTNANIQGATENSRELQFYPGPIQNGHYIADCQTAGSIHLMFQAALPLLLKTGGSLDLRGGTDVRFSPPSFFVKYALTPILQHFGVKFTYHTSTYGFYPAGGGQVRITCEPLEQVIKRRFMPIDLTEKGEITEITGELLFNPVKGKQGRGQDSQFYADVMKELSKLYTDNAFPVRPRVGLTTVNSRSPSAVLVLIAKSSTGETFSFTAMQDRLKGGEKGSSLGREAARGLVAEINKPDTVDEHLQDQLLIYMAMAEGVSRIRVSELTLHSQGVLHILETFLGVGHSFEDGILSIEGRPQWQQL